MGAHVRTLGKRRWQVVLTEVHVVFSLRANLSQWRTWKEHQGWTEYMGKSSSSPSPSSPTSPSPPHEQIRSLWRIARDQFLLGSTHSRCHQPLSGPKLLLWNSHLNKKHKYKYAATPLRIQNSKYTGINSSLALLWNNHQYKTRIQMQMQQQCYLIILALNCLVWKIIKIQTRCQLFLHWDLDL